MKELMNALLQKETNRITLAQKLDITISYLAKLNTGERIASKKLLKKIIIAYPDLKSLCMAVQLNKVMDLT